jgi:GT2 family glycosyltransferase
MSAIVSIIILNFNNAQLTLGCIGAVVEHTRPGSYEIIVVDNGSRFLDANVLLSASQNTSEFRVVRLSTNRFFGEANNIGVEHALGEHVLFLNNDVKVTPGWLEGLMEALNREHGAGAVGPRMLYPDGRLQEAGAFIRPDGWVVQFGKASTPPAWYLESNQVVDYCSAACLLMRISDFLNSGGFDPLYDPAYFEDVDLAIRLRSVGLFVYYCKEVAVYHEENATSRLVWTNDEMQAHIAINHRRLVQRWGGYLQQRLADDCEPQALPSIRWEPEADRRGKDLALIYAAEPISISPTAESLLKVACDLQDVYDVVIASDEIVSRCRVYSLARQFGLPLTSFRTRRLQEVNQADCAVIVSLEGDAGSCDLANPHFVLEREEPGGWARSP